MRKLSFVLATLCAVAVSCTKEQASNEPAERVAEKTDAQVVEEIITKSYSQMDSLSANDVKSWKIAHYLITDLLPKYGVMPILKPVWDQIKDCYRDDTLRVGLNDIHGHFKAAFNTWYYTDADDLQFEFPGIDGEKVRHSIVCGDELTQAPIYSRENIFILMPEQIDVTTVVEQDTVSSSRLVSEIIPDGSFKDGTFKYSGKQLDDLRSQGVLKFTSSSDEISEMSVDYSIVDRNDAKVFGITYEWCETPADLVVITFGDRVRFKLEGKDIVSTIATLVLANTLLDKDQSESTLESIREMVQTANENLNVTFYLDEVIQGKLKFALIEDNGVYAVDLVMVYEKDGTEYQIKNIVPAAKALISRISAFIGIFNDIKDYLDASI